MSLHERICDAVAAAVGGITPSVGTVTYRQDAWRLKGDPLPLVVVTKGNDRDVTKAFGGRVLREYEVLLTIVVAGNFRLVTGTDAATDPREVVREALMPDPAAWPVVLAGVAEVTHVRTSGSWQTEKAVDGYQVARLLLTYTATEHLRGA